MNTTMSTSVTSESELKEALNKQTIVSENKSRELNNLDAYVKDVKKENSHFKEKIAALEVDLRRVLREKEELLTRFDNMLDTARLLKPEKLLNLCRRGRV